MRRSLLLVPALLLGACGDDPTPGERALSNAAEAMERVQAGSLRFRVAATTTGQPDRPVGFEVAGPFRLAEKEGALPEVELAVTDLLGRRSQEATFVSDGRRASVTQDGRTTELDDDAVAHLRGRADPENGLLRLRIDEWAESPRRDGERVVAEVDALDVLNDVIAVAADVGAEPREFERLRGEDADSLRRSVRSSRLEAVLDEGTDVPRRVRATITFGRLAGVQLQVEIDLDDVELRRDR